MAPSRRQTRKAAKTLCQWWTGPCDAAVPVPDDVLNAWVLIRDYRATFQRPLDKVTIQLRRFVAAEAGEVIVAQRLKRMPTILNKLERQPAMDITRMQDIGGCRAVLPTSAVVDAVVDRIRRHWEVQRVYDYVEAPKPTGYRAVHVSVIRNERLIEIQLRTPRQQQWAEGVERAGSRLGVGIKDGVGPPEILEFFQLLGVVVELEESGKNADDAIMARLDFLTEQVRGLMPRNG